VNLDRLRGGRQKQQVCKNRQVPEYGQIRPCGRWKNALEDCAFYSYNKSGDFLYEQPCEVFRCVCFYLAGGSAAGRRRDWQERVSGWTLPSSGGLHRSALADQERVR